MRNSYCTLIVALLIGMTSVAISGCTTAPITPDTLTQSDLDAGSGLLVGAISRGPGDWPYTTYSVWFREVGSKDNVDSHIKMSATNSLIDFGKPKFGDDFVSDDSSGALFANLLPAGEYEFYQYYLYFATGVGGNTFRSREDFSIGFTIEPGRITYLGEFRADPVRAENMFRISIPAGVNLRLHNARQRDLSILMNKYPGLDISNVISTRELGCETIYEC